MLNETDDIDELDVNNPNLYVNLREKLYSIRDQLKISIIGKVSTPTNLLIKKLTDIDLALCRTWEINRYCTVISNLTKICMKEHRFSDNENYQLYKKYCLNEKKGCLVVYKKMSKNEPLVEDVLVKNLGRFLEKNINNDIEKFKIYLPKSENSILNKCIIYNPPPIGYSDELDKFVVEQCYKSCYLYVFVINTEESILEKEMKIISMLMKKKTLIELKFIMAYSGKMSGEDYIITEQHYSSKIKEIHAKFPGIIVISGHGYMSFDKKSNDDVEPNEIVSINASPNKRRSKSLPEIVLDPFSLANVEDAIPVKYKIADLGSFLVQKPTEDMIWVAVKNFKLKTKLSNKSKMIFDFKMIIKNIENIKCELKNSVKNLRTITKFISKSVKSNDELKNKSSKFNKTIASISFDRIFGSYYVIFGNSQINSLDILQALIGQPISNEENLTEKLSIIQCNFTKINREYFLLKYDNKSINNKYDIYELNNLSELISNLGLSANENISIELYLDNEIHPIIKDEMKIIYFNDFDINNEELLKENQDHYKIAVILDYKSDNDKNRDIIRYFQYKNRHVQFDILVNHDEMYAQISSGFVKKDIERKLELEIGDLINESDFYITFYKILSNLKYRKIINEIISLVHQFILHFDKPINFNVNIKDISDLQFQQLEDNINWNIKLNISENILNTANEEVIKFINKIIMENLDISDEILFPGIIFMDTFEDAKGKISNFAKADAFLNHYAANKTRYMKKINEIYVYNAREILSNSKRYKKIMNEIIDNFHKHCKSNIFLYQNSNK